MNRWISLGVGLGAAALGVGALLAAGATTAGCGACDCAVGGLSIQVPAGRAADVASVSAVGPACASTTAACITSTRPCALYHVDAVAEGACRVEVRFTSGAPSETFDGEFRRFGGCCAGLYAQGGGFRSVRAGDSAVPTDAGADARD